MRPEDELIFSSSWPQTEESENVKPFVVENEHALELTCPGEQANTPSWQFNAPLPMMSLLI